MSEHIKVACYAAVIYGSYNTKTECYELRLDSSDRITFIPAKHVARVVNRLKDGYTHITADPVFGLTRDEAGYLLSNADSIMKEINSTKYSYPS